MVFLPKPDLGGIKMRQSVNRTRLLTAFNIVPSLIRFQIVIQIVGLARFAFKFDGFLTVPKLAGAADS